MLGDDNQTQNAGDNTVNIQAKNIVVNGVTYSEAKDIALTVFRENFPKMIADAKLVVENRIEAFVNEFLSKLNEAKPLAFDNLRRPDVQSALFNAQKEFAKFGDGELGNVLIELLVRRTTTDGRTIYQIFLDEALAIVPRLTREHIDYLSLNFIVYKTKEPIFRNVKDLSLYYHETLLPHIESLSKVKSLNWHNREQYVDYLNSIGCSMPANNHLHWDRLDYSILKKLSQLMRPLDISELPDIFGDIKLKDVSEPHWLDPQRLQWKSGIQGILQATVRVNAKNSQTVSQFLQEYSLLNGDNRAWIFEYSKIIPQFELIAELANIESNPRLTPVGKIIAEANINIKAKSHR